jgi:uncharacterized cupin superfamily protein
MSAERGRATVAAVLFADLAGSLWRRRQEEVVVVTGTATFELWLPDGEVEETPLRPAHLVARPSGTGVSHSFRAGLDGVTMLVYGTRDPNDMCWYPRSKKIKWRGLGVIGRIETLDYLDGEPVRDD